MQINKLLNERGIKFYTVKINELSSFGRNPFLMNQCCFRLLWSRPNSSLNLFNLFRLGICENKIITISKSNLI